MKPGDRVTMKYDKRFHYGTVVERSGNSEKRIFVVWDRFPNSITGYKGEIRLVRPNEEINFPEEREVK